MKDKVVSVRFGALEDGGKEFCCESEATIMEWGGGYASISAWATGRISTKSASG